jgi:hypothetical protein
VLVVVVVEVVVVGASVVVLVVVEVEVVVVVVLPKHPVQSPSPVHIVVLTQGVATIPLRFEGTVWLQRCTVPPFPNAWVVIDPPQGVYSKVCTFPVLFVSV